MNVALKALMIMLWRTKNWKQKWNGHCGKKKSRNNKLLQEEYVPEPLNQRESEGEREIERGLYKETHGLGNVLWQ